MDKHILEKLHTPEGLQRAVHHLEHWRSKVRPGRWRIETLTQTTLAALLDALIAASEREAGRVE